MTSPRRRKEIVELDVGVERIIKDLEDALEAIPTLIFLLKLAQAQAMRKLREAEETDLAILGDRPGAREPALKRREAEG